MRKKPPPRCQFAQIFFHLGGIRVGVSAFGRGVCQVIFGSRGGVHTPTHPPPCPSMFGKVQKFMKHQNSEHLKCVKIADFETFDLLTSISRKILVTEKFLKFHCVISARFYVKSCLLL